jgi:hypothetical protein
MPDTETLTRAVLTTDGRVLVEQPDGSYRPATSETDWSRVDRMSEAELAAAIAADPDDPANDPGFWERARLVYPKKERVTLRLDADFWLGFAAKDAAISPASTPSSVVTTSTPVSARGPDPRCLPDGA